MDKFDRKDIIFYSLYILLALIYCFVTIKFVPVSRTTNLIVIFTFLIINTIYRKATKKH